MHARFAAAVALLVGLAACGDQHMPRSATPVPPTPTDTAATTAAPTAAAGAASPQAPLDRTVAPDLAARLAKFGPFVVDFDDTKLGKEQKTVLKKLVEAGQLLHELFLRQLDERNPERRAALAADASQADALRYFDIMAGPWDGLAHDEPFIGKQARLPGAAWYPADATKTEIEQHLASHPADKDAFTGYFSVIRRQQGKLVAVPYSVAYQPLLAQAAAKLREAAALVTEPTLKRFLELRAAAFASDDYFESDMAWMDVKGPIEVTIGPYETYADQLFQYKASFEAFVALRDVEESKKLEIVSQNVPELEKNLPLDEKHKKAASKKGGTSPIDVVHLLYNAGQSGVQTVAYNLPNDERVAQAKGTKKVMLKNIFQGKFENIVRPIAAKVLADDMLPLLNAEAVFTYILMHEVAHGVGPGFITLADGTKTDVQKALRDLYGGIEEAKADITGLVNGQFLIDKGVYPKAFEKQMYVAYLATAFRQMRFGLKEAHGRSIVSSVSYFLRKGAIGHDAKTGKFRVDFGRIKQAARELSHELLTIEAEGSYDKAKAFFDEYARVRPELEQALNSLGKDIPVDIAPRFTIVEKMRSW